MTPAPGSPDAAPLGGAGEGELPADPPLAVGATAALPASSSGGAASPRRRKAPLPAWQESLLLVGTAVLLALIIKTFFLQAFYIPSGSMRDTLKVDDRILVEKWSYWMGDVDRGDIVVFDDPANWLGEEDGRVPGNPVTKTLSMVGLYPTGGHLVKRVIGVGGDSVDCSDGRVEVNGTALDEADYVTLPVQACTGSWSVVVPADHIWVMGDNREESADSRVHLGDPGGGFIPVDDVVGKVFVVVWPLDRWGLVHRPATFDDPALQAVAGLVPGPAPVGLALIAVPTLYRRLHRERRQR